MLRFSIRDVLWLTFVVALFVAWRLDRHNMKLAHTAALEREKALYDRDFEHWLWTNSTNKVIEDSKRLGAPQPIPLPLGYGEKPNLHE
jgi:hypothetical protein